MSAFEQKIPIYTTTIRDWFESEKPYLYSEFKLLDVMRIVPLNRSYLSRVFNDGFGRNFSEVVGSYRVEYARKLILKCPAMPLQRVWELSGFKTDSTFTRLFKQEIGCTPAQFKKQQKPNV